MRSKTLMVRSAATPRVSNHEAVASSSEFVPLFDINPKVEPRGGFALRPCARAQYLQHKLHRHQHRVVAALKPALGDAAEMVDQRDVEFGL